MGWAVGWAVGPLGALKISLDVAARAHQVLADQDPGHVHVGEIGLLENVVELDDHRGLATSEGDVDKAGVWMGDLVDLVERAQIGTRLVVVHLQPGDVLHDGL